ncbi:hypothetical protein LXE92_06625 [Burkholderia contaminans]|nr:hypothetical protein [Burkholderia contaminans]WFN11029.1 hypothetical protein LXE92_06625 [Burkholderia contaminans]
MPKPNGARAEAQADERKRRDLRREHACADRERREQRATRDVAPRRPRAAIRIVLDVPRDPAGRRQARVDRDARDETQRRDDVERMPPAPDRRHQVGREAAGETAERRAGDEQRADLG